MPKIRIKETDATGRIQNSVISNTVFIPLKYCGTPLNAETEVGPNGFAELSSYSELFDLVKNSTESSGLQYTADSNAYKVAKHLLNLGFKIVIKAVPTLTDEGGVNTSLSLSTEDFTLLKDKNYFDLRFLTAGCLTGTSRISQDLVTCAKERGDCVALLDLDESVEVFSYNVSTIRTALSSLSDGEFAAAFTPWFYTKNSDFQDIVISDGKEQFKNEEAIEELVPASYGYLFAYANSIKNNPEWYAVAGFERGIIPELSSVCHRYTGAEVEVLQGRSANGEVELDDPTDNVGFAINPIADIRPAGYIIYGNRTLKANSSSKKTTAVSFLNVRNMISAIKKQMYEASKKFTFEPNNDVLWMNFQCYITPLLDRMQSGNGILGYSFTKQKANGKARLAARLKIVPIEAVEDFDLEVFMTDDLTTVSE